MFDFHTRSEYMPPCEIDLLASHNRDITQRRYAKIDVVFGNISGTISFLILFFALITKLRNDMFVVTETMNLLYSFPKENDVNIERNDKIITEEKYAMTSPRNIELPPQKGKIKMSGIIKKMSRMMTKTFSQSLEKNQELEKYHFSFNFFNPCLNQKSALI